MAAAANMLARLKGHMPQHIGAEKLQALKHLHTIFADAAAANAAAANADDPPHQSHCRVVTPLAVDAAGPKEAVCIPAPPVQRPSLSPAPPPRVARTDVTAPTPQQVYPRPAGERSHLPPQAPETAPRQRAPTTCAGSWHESPQQSQGPLNATMRTTRLAALKARLAAKDERDAAGGAHRLQRQQSPNLDVPAMNTRRKTS